MVSLNELKRATKQANQRILRIEKNFGKDKYISSIKKRLDIEPLKAFNLNSNRIRFSKNYTEQQIEAIYESIQKFLKWSTIKQIKKRREQSREDFRKYLQRRRTDDEDLDDEDLDDEELDFIDELYNDKDFWAVTQGITPSDFYEAIKDAQKYRWDYQTFSEQVTGYIKWDMIKDVNINEKLRNIFNKYIEKI